MVQDGRSSKIILTMERVNFSFIKDIKIRPEEQELVEETQEIKYFIKKKSLGKLNEETKVNHSSSYNYM